MAMSKSDIFSVIITILLTVGIVAIGYINNAKADVSTTNSIKEDVVRIEGRVDKHTEECNQKFEMYQNEFKEIRNLMYEYHLKQLDKLEEIRKDLK